MSGIGSSLVSPAALSQHAAAARSEGKRTRIVDAAMRHFAEQGYHAARVGDIAAALGIAKGSIFQHFGSKDGFVLRSLQEGGAFVSAIPGCSSGSSGARFFRSVALLAGEYRAPGARRLDPVPGFVARKLWHGPDLEARDQSLSDGGRSIRHGGICALSDCSAANFFTKWIRR